MKFRTGSIGGGQLRLYTPFVAFLLVQALFVAFLPSRADRQELRTGAVADNPPLSATAPDGTPLDVTDSTTPGGAVSAGKGTTGANGSSGSVGDTSKCTKDGRQFDADYAPPCQPKWVGKDNGGATTIGVTRDSIEVFVLRPKQSAEVSGAYGEQPTRQPALDAFASWINKHYELYGRKLHVKEVDFDCPDQPPDYDRCYAAARYIASLKPFAVIWPVTGYAEVYDIWSQAGILSFGGFWEDESLYAGRRPYRWNIFMDGTQTSDAVAEFYCKNMAGGAADHAGVVIHPTIGGRSTKRRVAIMGGNWASDIAVMQRFRADVKACTNGQEEPVIVSVSNDLSNAASTLSALTSKLISEKVTTVVCRCELLATQIVTNYFTSNSYYPEHLLPGVGFVDADAVGRAANPDQWAHAFGLGQLGPMQPADQSAAVKTWREEGHSGMPCGESDCGLESGYLGMIASGAQLAGPTLNALTFERGLQSQPLLRPHPDSPGGKFGPGDYSFFSDVKLIYWDKKAKSTGDGAEGAYIALDKGARHVPGAIPKGVMARVPVAPQ